MPDVRPEPLREDGARVIDKVLVADRGEIARRIVRTLRAMGIASVAVFSDSDRDAPHAAEADEAVRLEGPDPEVYRDVAAMLEAARVTGADAVHPGYGFLAESAVFAERCVEAGLVFIGPPAAAIRSMADKARAKDLAAEAGLPVIAGFAAAGLDAAAIRARAEALGFPLLIKAVAGGGGKGLRAVRRPDELDEALEAAAREARSAFADDALIVERLHDAPRHVEVQVLADAHGHAIHLFERDCSLQRRHQKVVEECPSPAVDSALRERLGEAAVALTQAVGYVGAGTVELLLDPGGDFFFLEMNTRLQVEHGITEAVTGLDLVRLQVAIARGEALAALLGDEPPVLRGHAIEARLYAEDPSAGFLPAAGTVALWSVPTLRGLRVDSGVERGATVGVHFDPLLAKVIAHGHDRDEALRRLHRGLSALAVGGLATNRGFLLAALEHPAFRRGEVDTGFVDRHLPTEARARPVDREAVALHAVAATLDRFAARRRRPSPLPPGVPPGWRNNRWRPQIERFEHTAGRVEVRYQVGGDGRLRCRIVGPGDAADRSVEARVVAGREGGPTEGAADASPWTIETDGVRRRYRIAAGADGVLWVHALDRISALRPIARLPLPAAPAVAGGCAAPMTGVVRAVRVKVGDHVEAGRALVILEAMKMEHSLEARADGVVEAVRVEVGQMVDPDQVLVVVAPRAGDDLDPPEGAGGDGP